MTLPRTAKVVVGAKKVLKLKNNKRAVKWKVSKGKKYVKIVKKSKKSCTVKGLSLIHIYCSLRKWLNNDFINEAFSEYERTQIILNENRCV